MSDAPIEPLSFVAGVTVVDIGDIRVARGLARRPSSACTHRALRFDRNERRVWCADCEKTVEAFDAFVLLVEQFANAAAEATRREERVAEAEAHQIVSIAAKTMDKAWRSRSMIPVCPHCRTGLFPEDFKSEPAMVSREFAGARRKKETGA